MARYRSRPSEIEAVQFDPQGKHRQTLPEGVHCIPPTVDNYADTICFFWVVTIQGNRVQIKAGEWIITEPDDATRRYPCAPDVFAKRWELIDEPR